MSQQKFDPFQYVGPEYFGTMGAANLTWFEIIGELLDNSIEHGQATQMIVSFRSQDHSVEVVDDGIGCDDAEKMFSLGMHYSRGRKGIARYGVGLKDAATWLWGHFFLRTRSSGEIQSIKINWPDYCSQTDRHLNVDRRLAKKEDLFGTKLTFIKVRPSFPNYKALYEDICFYFSPALQAGKQILLILPKGEKMTSAAWRLPTFEGASIYEEFDIDGKHVKLTAGVVTENLENPRKGYSFFHAHRVIKNTMAWGSGGHSLGRFCAMIELDSNWKLSKNKTDIVDNQDALEAEVFKRCEFLIIRAEKQTRVFANSKLDSKVTALLRSRLEQRRKEKEKRVKPEKSKEGTVIPKNTKRKRRRARRKQPGDHLADLNSGGIRLDWERRTDGLIGRADLGPNACVILLNENHSHCAAMREQENDQALAQLCWFLAVEENQRYEKRGDNLQGLLFPKTDGGLIGLLSKMLEGHQDKFDEPQVDEEISAG